MLLLLLYRPFKRPRPNSTEEPADRTGQPRVVRSRLDSPSDPDSTTQDPTPERSGMLIDQPKSGPIASNAQGTQQLNGHSRPKHAKEEGQSAAVGSKQDDAHMQGTSLPAANGFTSGMGSAAAANGATAPSGNLQNGYSSSGQKTNGDTGPRQGNGGQPSSSSSSSKAQKDSNAGAHGMKEQLSEDNGSHSPSKEGPCLKRMSWMEPDAPAANGQMNGQANGQAKGEGPEQSTGTGLSRENGDSAGVAWPQVLQLLCGESPTHHKSNLTWLYTSQVSHFGGQYACVCLIGRLSTKITDLTCV